MTNFFFILWDYSVSISLFIESYIKGGKNFRFGLNWKEESRKSKNLQDFKSRAIHFSQTSDSELLDSWFSTNFEYVTLILDLFDFKKKNIWSNTDTNFGKKSWFFIEIFLTM